MEKEKPKPKGFSGTDIREAIAAEATELVKENKDVILKRARRRLREKFGR